MDGLDLSGIDLAEVDRELVRRGGLPEFVRQGWHVLEPMTELRWNWHLDAICEHLEAVIRGELRRLAIAVPPGSMKSLLSSVFLPAYVWGPFDRPGWRALFASYSGTLSTRDSVRCRRLIESPWFQERWPLLLTTDQNTKTRFENEGTGWRVAASVGGTVTGDRGNAVVCDDLLDRRRADSEAHRAEASDFFWETVPSRVNNLDEDAFIVISQRLHQRDTIGEIQERAGGRWEQLIIPLEFEADRRCTTGTGWKDPRTEEGEIMHPGMFSRETVDNLKSDLGSHAFNGQYQQRPAPREGALIKTAWLSTRYRIRGSAPLAVVQSWDTASKPAEHNDPTACVTAAVFHDRVEVWHVWAGRVEFPDLVRKAKDFYASDEVRGPNAPNAVLVEDKDSGQGLIQQLRRETSMPVLPVNPGSLDKFTRMSGETPMIEAGKLWLPEDAPWVAGYVDELTTFPGSAHKDRVDATSQLLKYVREAWDRLSIAGPVSVTRMSPVAV